MYKKQTVSPTADQTLQPDQPVTPVFGCPVEKCYLHKNISVIYAYSTDYRPVRSIVSQGKRNPQSLRAHAEPTCRRTTSWSPFLKSDRGECATAPFLIISCCDFFWAPTDNQCVDLLRAGQGYNLDTKEEPIYLHELEVKAKCRKSLLQLIRIITLSHKTWAAFIISTGQRGKRASQSTHRPSVKRHDKEGFPLLSWTKKQRKTGAKTRWREQWQRVLTLVV